MKKRLTKADREAAEKQRLYNRLRDFALGANSGHDLDGGDDVWSMGLAEFSRFMRCVEKQLVGIGSQSYLVATYNLDEYQTLTEATEFLFSHGIRADGPPEDDTEGE